MSFSVYLASAPSSNSVFYEIEKCSGSLWFAAFLEQCKVVLHLCGQPRDYVFIADHLNETDIILKRHNWVATIKKSDVSCARTSGYFVGPEIDESEVHFLDRDALIFGVASSVSAAVYRANSGELYSADYQAGAFLNVLPAPWATLQRKNVPQ